MVLAADDESEEETKPAMVSAKKVPVKAAAKVVEDSDSDDDEEDEDDKLVAMGGDSDSDSDGDEVDLETIMKRAKTQAQTKKQPQQ